MLTPCPLNSRINSSKRVVSVSVRLDVGSSMMMSRAFSESALAISTICWWARDRRSRRVRVDTFSPSRWRYGSVSAWIFLRLINPNAFNGSRPRNTLAATSRLSSTLSSWWMNAMPSFIASVTPLIFTGWPSTRISPASGWQTPPRIFMRVDFPAPFSPQSATTSPRPICKQTESSATTPGNPLEIPRISSSGAVFADKVRRI